MSITDQMPEVNRSSHCWDEVSPEYPSLYKCPTIEEVILACQKLKQERKFSSRLEDNELNNKQAEVLAQHLWDLFLEGKGTPDIRPFGRLGKIKVST